MGQDIGNMYSHSSDILTTWMEKLFPSQDQGCINFGYWKGIKRPLTLEKRIVSQKQLYGEIFQRFSPQSTTILEVGCGRGHAIFWLREKGYTAYGIDVLISQIEKCREEYPDLAFCFKNGKAEEIPFEEEKFDSVYSLEAAQHFTSFDSFCKESFRVLKTKGKLIVSTYFINDKLFTEDLKKIIPDNLEGFHNALPISEAVSHLQASGFLVDPPSSIGKEVFPLYSAWQKKQLRNTPISALSQERAKWKGYYTGGGREPHPWYQAFTKGWVDYYILEATKTSRK